jgi:23S rRNA (uracil1939-C5)-methyltransferase
MQRSNLVPFKISSMDSLGQGVSKLTPKITFIPKTLPDESGEAQIVSEKKGVAFARMSQMTETSPDRIVPECVHFSVCPSCHYLHTPYVKELEFKRQNLEKLFQKIPHPSIEVIPAVRRLAYRNRVQLHYDLKQKKLGMFDVGANSIAPIPHCLITLPALKLEIEKLYANDEWFSEAPKHLPRGHVELYLQDGKVKKSWNEAYAHGGFTQVFDEMNLLLREKLKVWWANSPTHLLDLFAGNGNLSKELNYSSRLCVDIYPKGSEGEFISKSLYEDDALSFVKKSVQQKALAQPDLLLDPPRSGLKNLDVWLDTFSPSKVAYVSCDPHTLARDLSQVKNYDVTKLLLIDFFPSTFHFETVAFLTRKK